MKKHLPRLSERGRGKGKGKNFGWIANYEYHNE